MRKPSALALLVYGALVIGGGIAIGSGFARSTADKMRRHLTGMDVPDTAAQYRPDVNGFAARTPSRQSASRSDDPVSYEYGKYRNGKRVLVPGEPARKKDRTELAREMAWQNDLYLDGDMTEPADLGPLPEVSAYNGDAAYESQNTQARRGTKRGNDDNIAGQPSVTVSYGSDRTDTAADKPEPEQPSAEPADVEATQPVIY